MIIYITLPEILLSLYVILICNLYCNESGVYPNNHVQGL